MPKKYIEDCFETILKPADAENDPVSPVDIRGSSTDNNTNLQSTA
ncbi:hypothetical protein H5410_001705 [Solanum commersonii]|nr:hypothetical protein H5410_001705 [Solanum commersonii]